MQYHGARDWIQEQNQATLTYASSTTVKLFSLDTSNIEKLQEKAVQSRQPSQ